MKQFFKFVFATMVGLFLFGIVSIFIVFGLVGAIAASGSETTTAKPSSVYQIDMSGVLSDRATDDPMSAAFAEAMNRSADNSIGLNDLLRNIQKAKENDNIKGIYLKGGSLSMGFGAAKELRDALSDFKQSGKFIVAYADSYGQGNYYVASVADHLYVNAQGSIGWSGLSSTLRFMKGTLDKLGVEMQVVKVGTFKSAVEPYVNTQMSDANRLQYTVLLGDIWQQITTEVGQSRSLTVEQLNELADRQMALQDQQEYVANHMVDSLIYSEDMKAILERLTETEDYVLLSHSQMNNLPEAKNRAKDKVAILYAEGSITDDSGDGIVGTRMVKSIDKLAEDDKVKAVVLRVNSPGGSAYASEQIWNALRLLKEKKPLIVSMGDYAASGGYYISCVADSIIAQPTTLTGSIGIFGLIPCVKELSQKVGLTYDGVQTNKHSALETNATLYGMNAEERALVQAEVNRGYELFTQRCADGRQTTQQEIKKIAEGRVWSGVQAVKLGLVDKLGSLDDAVKSAALKAGLENYKIVEYPAQLDFYDRLMKALDMESTVQRIAERRLGKEYTDYVALQQLLEQAQVRAEMPYISIR